MKNGSGCGEGGWPARHRKGGLACQRWHGERPRFAAVGRKWPRLRLAAADGRSIVLAVVGGGRRVSAAAARLRHDGEGFQYLFFFLLLVHVPISSTIGTPTFSAGHSFAMMCSYCLNGGGKEKRPKS